MKNKINHTYVDKLIQNIRKRGLLYIFKFSMSLMLVKLRQAILFLLFFKKSSPGVLKTYLPIITPIKIKNRHIEVTLIHSVDSIYEPSKYLMETALKAAQFAFQNKNVLNDCRFEALKGKGLSGIDELVNFKYSINIWPGEHYRLLTGLVRSLEAKKVIEIGTFWGIGTLALYEGLGKEGEVITYDIVPWNKFESTFLKDEDFKNNRISQVLGDLQDDNFFLTQKNVFENADLIFMDAAKDGIMERKFLEQFSKCRFKSGAILVVDDIKLWNMLDIWEEIKLPKIDITGLGHYTGTGLVELSCTN